MNLEHENIVESRSCRMCGASFEVSDRDGVFYRKLSVPHPTLCPPCRMRRRLSFRNDRSLYWTVSSRSGSKILSMYDPTLELTIYEYKEWWSDTWDARTYGRAVSFERPFFEQFRDLQRVVPRFNLFNRDSENCDYVNYAPHCKSCYLLFGSWFSQDCWYGQSINECRDCIDNLFLDKSELCYQCVDCTSCYNSVFCEVSSGLTECSYCIDCHECQNCMLCSNLRGKQYYVRNKSVGKDRYNELRNRLGAYSAMSTHEREFRDLVQNRAIHRAMSGFQNENVTGDFIFSCKNAKWSFSAYRSEDIAYCSRIFESKDSYDFEGGGKGELTYECMSNDFAYHSIGCTTCEQLKFSHYCDLCFNCKYCFGCVGLRNAEYCILNTQYSQSEYERLESRVRVLMQSYGEWGEFFPSALALFAYNETLAQEYFPQTSAEAKALGYRWKEKNVESHPTSYLLPDSIDQVSDEVCTQLLSCGDCDRNYKIHPRELSFYKTWILPLPRACPECRHAQRMLRRNPRELRARKCSRCQKNLSTTCREDRAQLVYCEDCYQSAV